jgi:hypothetical protein
LSAPYTAKFSACTLAISPQSCSSRIARANRGRRFADQYVDGAKCKALQIGSTPNLSRCASM